MSHGSPTSGELLSVWERAAGQRGARRALSMLAAAWPGRSVEDLGAETIGRRDGLLLALREGIFGPRLDCTTECSRCRELLEFTLVLNDLKADGPSGDRMLSLSADPYAVTFRLPDSRDLLAVEREGANPNEAARALLERCVVEASEEGEAVAPAQLPPQVVDLIDAAMQAKDPQADIEVSLSCPLCGLGWQETFDIAGYLWEELDAWAGRVVRDVHVLASTYGWREADILAMSPGRRSAYLDLIRE